MAPNRPAFAIEEFEVSHFDGPSRGMCIFKGTAVDVKEDSKGEKHRQLVVAAVYVTLDEGDGVGEGRRAPSTNDVWLYFERKRFGKIVAKKDWQSEHLYEFR